MTAKKSPRQRSAAKPASRPAPVRARSAASERLIERARRICLALPDAHEKLSHGEPTWFAGAGKVFAMVDDHRHGAPHLSLWLTAPRGAQEALIASDPARYFRPPYVGHRGWVGVVLDDGPDWRVVAALVEDAYRHVAAQQLIARLDASDA